MKTEFRLDASYGRRIPAGDYSFDIEEIEITPTEDVFRISGAANFLGKGFKTFEENVVIEDYLRYDWSATRCLCQLMEDNKQTDYRDSLRVKKVIFNPPATIIFWNDDTKTVVKCQPCDKYDRETGFVMAYLKKLLGNDNTFNKEINKFVHNVEEN